MENIEDKKINSGIKELKELKMTEVEKNTILKNILQTQKEIKEVPVKSPFSISSFIFGTNMYVKIAVFLILIITGGGFILDSQNSKKQTIARNNTNIDFSQSSYHMDNKGTTDDTVMIAIAPDNNTNNFKVNAPDMSNTSSSGSLIKNNKSMMLSTSGAPLTSNDSQKYIDISKPIFEEWLKTLIKEKGGAESYTINNITYVASKEKAKENELSWFTKESTNNAFIVNVTYSIKMTNTNDYNYWMAGNGIEGSDNWILNKSLFVTIDKNINGYYVLNAGTGM